MDYKRFLENKIPGSKTGIKVKKSICSICESPRAKCGLDVYVKDGVIVKVEGSKENPSNNGTLCAKGAAARQYVYSKDRLKTPLKRIGPKGAGKFVPITWNEALDTIADRLKGFKKDFGPESVVFCVGYAKWMRPYLQRLASAFGTPNYCTEYSVCYQAAVMAWKLLFGKPANPDLENAKCLFVWTANPFYTNTAGVRKLLDRKDQGLKIIVVDPRYSPMAAQADLHLQLKPGTDGALALSLANVIINDKLYDKNFVENYTYGFEEYRKYVQEFPPETGERMTGVPQDKIREAAYLYATTKPGAFMTGASPVVHHTNGVQNYRAALSLVALTGNYDRFGGNLTTPPASYNNVYGGFPTKLAQYCKVKEQDEMAPCIGEKQYPLWNELIGEAQGTQLPFQIASQAPYALKALVAFGVNHRMWPDSDFILDNIQKLDFFVNIDLFMTDTSKYADILLPACSSLERKEFHCYASNYVIYTQPAIKPLYESRPDVDIIFDLAQRLGLNDPLLKAGYEKSLDWILEPGGLTIAELKKHPGGRPLTRTFKTTEKKYMQTGFSTPTGKVEFKSMLLEKYFVTHGYTALPEYKPPKYSKEATPGLAAKYPLILNTGSRLPMFIHSRTFRLPWTHSLRPGPAADLNPDDAQRLGIGQGDKIKISTPKGAIVVKANLTEMVQPGVVHMYHAYKEADVNLLIEANYLDPISGYPGFKSLLCKVEKAGTC